MRVGVIAAVKGPAPYLDEALRSVLSQEPAPGRVVVVDHASPSPLEVPAGVELVRGDDGGGPARARQRGLDALDTELIALIDADDVWEPSKLAAQIAALGEAAVCFGRAQVIDASGRPTGEQLPELAGGVHPSRAMARALYERNWVPAASALIRREALEAAGGFEGSGRELPAGSDWDLWLRLAAAGFDFVCEPKARIRYRRHVGGLTSSVSRLAEAALQIHERHRDLVDEETARKARAQDLVALARGRIRERRYAEARAALAEAASLDRPTARVRALRTAIAIPVARSALGRRSPYPKAKV